MSPLSQFLFKKVGTNVKGRVKPNQVRRWSAVWLVWLALFGAVGAAEAQTRTRAKTVKAKRKPTRAAPKPVEAPAVSPPPAGDWSELAAPTEPGDPAPAALTPPPVPPVEVTAS
ncbi:MAG TPA: hypothetical protein VEY30_01925, partial [Myxococcaceae bacterium]|nr:hypothetical protein [Myxococcaceae bacterium]